MKALVRRARHVALLLVLALVATGCGTFAGSGTYEIQAQFPATFNLFPGSPVTVLGLEVGAIREIEVREGDRLVTVTMVIQDEVLLPDGVNAVVVPDSLLGERYIQLDPPYTGGESLAANTLIPIDRTMVPFEFDEVLEGLNRFVGGLDEDEVARLIANLADVLEGQGAELGDTIDAADAAIQVLRENDDELIALASRLSDLNETLNTRDEELGEFLEDFGELARVLADDRVQIDQALSGLVRVTDELGRLLEVNRVDLEDDIATLARVGRTAQRNLDQISLLILSSAELYRHADRGVVDRENNVIPLLNHFGSLSGEIGDSLQARLVGACINAGIPEDTCNQLPIQDLLNDVCLPIAPCPADGSAGRPLPEVMEDIVREVPEEMAEQLIEQNEESNTGLADTLQDALDDVLDEVLGGDGERREGSLLGGGRR